MAINLLAKTKAPDYASMVKPAVPTNTATPYNANVYKPPVSTPAPNATSVANKQPVYMPPTAPVGVKATTPTYNVSGPSTTLPASQTVKPGVLTQAQLDAQNKANGVSQFNTGPAQVGGAIGSAPASPQNAPQATQQYSVANPPTYGGLVGQLANTALQGQGSQQAAEAYQKAQGINQQLEQAREQQAQAEANIAGAPHTVNFAQGATNVIRNQGFAQQQALSQQLQAQQGLFGTAMSGQGQQLTALQGAAGLAAPQQYSLTNQPYNPLTNTYGGGGSGGVLDRAKLAGQVAATQSNAQIAGTAGVNANQSVLNPAYNNYLQLQQTTQNIDGFGGLLAQTMQQGGINPSDVKYANARLADIRNALSSEQQAIYDNTLAGLRSRVSGLLAAGGSEIPTQITADANKILDGTLPLSALTGVLQRIQQEGNLLLNNAANVVNTAYSGATGGNQNGNTNQPITWDTI